MQLCREGEGHGPDGGRQGSVETNVPRRSLRPKGILFSILPWWRMRSRRRNLSHVPRWRVFARRSHCSTVPRWWMLCGGDELDGGHQGSVQTFVPCRLLRSKWDAFPNVPRWRMQSTRRNLSFVPRRRVFARRSHSTTVPWWWMLCGGGEEGRQGSVHTIVPLRLLRSNWDVSSNVLRWLLQSGRRNLAHVLWRLVYARRSHWSFVLGWWMLFEGDEQGRQPEAGHQASASVGLPLRLLRSNWDVSSNVLRWLLQSG